MNGSSEPASHDRAGRRRAVAGPLAGLRVVELGSIGPGPHAAMVLADLGADVVRVERPHGGLRLHERDIIMRGRRSVAADLKTPHGQQLVLGLAERADVLVEGFRPGVTERLGVGPEQCRSRNPRLVYARITGWGQHGPLAAQPGHDLNYLSMTGVLHALGSTEKPIPPMNLVGDYGGGSMLVLVGILAALHERERSGRGQVIDAAIVDGVSLLGQVVWSARAAGDHRENRQDNLLDGGAPFYDTYRCADGRFLAVAALEPQFFTALLRGLGLDGDRLPAQYDRTGWPVLRQRFATVIADKPRDEWAEHFAQLSACVTPVLTFAEAATHPHLRGRNTLVALDQTVQAASAPRFSRTPPGPLIPPPVPGADTADVLIDWGIAGGDSAEANRR